MSTLDDRIAAAATAVRKAGDNMPADLFGYVDTQMATAMDDLGSISGAQRGFELHAQGFDFI
jgi:hypothetical protein